MKLTKEEVKAIGTGAMLVGLASSDLTELIKTQTDDKFYEKSTLMCIENANPLRFYLNCLGKFALDVVVPAALTTTAILGTYELKGFLESRKK